MIFKKKYEENSKRVFSNFEEIDRQRISNIKLALLEYSKLMISTGDQRKGFSDHLKREIERIDESLDVENFIIQNETFQIPDPPVNYVSYESLKAQKSKISRVKSEPRKVHLPERIKKLGEKTAITLYDFAARDSTEISFIAGETVEISQYNIEDMPGWLEGTIRGKVGFLPSNYVEISYSIPIKAIAVFDFQARNPDELSINPGDVLTVLKEGNGWLFGRNSKNESGLFPSDYVFIPP